MPANDCDTRPLTVVVPCYNEAATVVELLDRVLASSLVGEVIVVDDASTDGTLELAQSVADDRVRVVAVATNRGKGAALREGFRLASRPFVIVQDADLEYDPCDYGLVLGPLLSGDADAVYGSRFQGSREHRVLYFWHMVGNRLLTLGSNIATNLNLSDMETCYKAFRRELIQDIEVEEDRFGFEPEITAKLAARKCRIYEVGISYHGRTYDEGKKITWRDGLRATYCILAYSPLGIRLRLRRLSGLVGRLTGA
jgi:glycosyltransferase involved in cell wall biosynthesis